MYTDNHPNIEVIKTLVYHALASSSLINIMDFKVTVSEDYLRESLILPVYPAIAKRIGILGSTRYGLPTYGIEEGASRFIELEEVVDRYYSIYESTPEKDLNHNAVKKVREILINLVKL